MPGACAYWTEDAETVARSLESSVDGLSGIRVDVPGNRPRHPRIVAGLTRIDPTAGQAVAATLTFRLLTFWIPIIPGLIALRTLRSRKLI
jgi:hypothetical protein